MVFSGFVVPDIPQLVALVVGTLLVTALLYSLRPPVTQPIVLAFVPWIVSGSILHVFYQIHASPSYESLYPPGLAQIFSAPAIYLTLYITMGVIWAVSTVIVANPDYDRQIATYLGVMGIGTAVPLIVLVGWQGSGEALELAPIRPILGLIISAVITFVVFILIGVWRTYIIAETRYVGALVIFAHTFDGITTAIGVELLDAGERSAFPQLILDLAADLPTADALGTAWLFVLVKIVIASIVVILFADYVRERPPEANLMFALVATVGLGPAINNFFLFVLGV